MNLGDGRIVVTRSGGNGGGIGPVVHMYVLHVNATASDSTRDEDMIKLLRILVEKEGVSFNGVHSGYLVSFEQNALQRGKCGTRLNVFIEVSCDHDIGIGIICQNRLNESLTIACMI